MLAAPSAHAAAAVASTSADNDGSPRRKIPRSGGITTHVTQFQATTSIPPAAQPPAIPLAAKPSYAGAIAAAAPSANPAKPIATSATPNDEPPSICLQAMIAGAKMLRKSKSLPASPSDATTALPSLGVLIKSVHFNKKQWRHYALFGCTEIEIVAAPNTTYPDELNPSIHPCRMVCMRSDLLNPKTPINASFLHVVTTQDIHDLKDLKVLAEFLPDGFGKIHYEPTGMHVKLMSSTYKSGADIKHTYLRPIYNHLGKKHLLIPVSNFHLFGKDYPGLEEAVLPAGTHVQFKIGMLPTDGGSFAFNLRLCTVLPFDNCYGSPPVKMESMIKLQPGGFKVDLHVAPFGISLKSEKCELLNEHIKTKIPQDSIALYITHSNDTMADVFSASVGELDRAFVASPLNCSWNTANLDQIVEMILKIKNNDKLNEHKAAKKQFTVVFTLANQNQQNIVTKTIAESYNTHKHAGHSLLHANGGVLLVLQPTTHSSKGIVAQVNAAQILSKAHCSALHSTHTFPPGYRVPYVKVTGRKAPDGQEQILGYSLTHISLLIFADSAKDSKLLERVIDLSVLDVDPIQITNETISIQWQPGSLKDEQSSHPILKLLEDEDFLRQAEVDRPKQERKKKHDDVIRTAYIKPRPGYNQAVLATLQMRKDILVLPNQSIDEDGFLLRSSRPYPTEGFELLKHPVTKFIQFISPYAIRIIRNDGFSNAVIPDVLKLDKTVAHNDDNFSLLPSAGSPWTEVIANGIHSTLGCTLLPPSEMCPYSYYIGGFTGFPTSEFLQEKVFLALSNCPLPVVDSRDETKEGGVFIQYLKSSIRPSTLHTKDVTIAVFSYHETTREVLKNIANVIDFETNGSLYQVTTGLQYLSVQATAVSITKGEAMCEEALNVIKAKYQEGANVNGYPQEWNEQDHHPYPDHDAEEQKEEEFVAAGNRRSARNKAKNGNTNTQQAKQTNNAPHNNQQVQSKKGNQFLALGDDDDVSAFNDPAVVAIATQPTPRKADAGDFDTTKDWRITNYLKDKWSGHRPEQQTQSVAKLVVTIWSRDHSDYHNKQLGNNFTGAKKLGGLLAALGRSRLKSLQQVTALLKDAIRNGTDVDKLCNKLDVINQDARELPVNSPQPQPQQQPAPQPQNSSTNGKQPNQPQLRTNNKDTTPNTANKNTITSHFNPLKTIPIDFTTSQDEISNTQADELMQSDAGSSPSSPGQGDKSKHLDGGLIPEEKADSSEPLPSSPFKTIANLASRALEFFSDNPAAGGAPYPAPNHSTAVGDGSSN